MCAEKFSLSHDKVYRLKMKRFAWELLSDENSHLVRAPIIALLNATARALCLKPRAIVFVNSIDNDLDVTRQLWVVF